MNSLTTFAPTIICAFLYRYAQGCSKSHLPSFITAQEELKSKGVEMTICIATNDAYVMEVRVSITMHSYFFY